MTIPTEIQEAILTERRRCIGIVLREFGLARLAGEEGIAHALDQLAIRLEYPQSSEPDVEPKPREWLPYTET